MSSSLTYWIESILFKWFRFFPHPVQFILMSMLHFWKRMKNNCCKSWCGIKKTSERSFMIRIARNNYRELRLTRSWWNKNHFLVPRSQGSGRVYTGFWTSSNRIECHPGAVWINMRAQTGLGEYSASGVRVADSLRAWRTVDRNSRQSMLWVVSIIILSNFVFE